MIILKEDFMPNLGYCPRCKTNVMLYRGDLNCCLFLLLLMTGVGWIIYLIIWLMGPEDRCVICGTVAMPPIPETNTPPSLPSAEKITVVSTSTTPSASGTFIPKKTLSQSNSPATSLPIIKNTKFCPYCGAEIPLEASFCSGCGVNLQK